MLSELVTNAFRGCDNLTCQQVHLVDPTTFVPNPPPAVLTDKAAFHRWWNTPDTKHLLYQLTEGINPGVRPGSQNPVRLMHGLIGDYDAKLTEEMVRTLRERSSTDLMPNFVSRTFSGGARVVWLFDRPVAVDNSKFVERLLKIAQREVRAQKLLPGLDLACWSNPNQL